METTPTPMPAAPSQTWLQKHERMVICALVLMVTMFLGNKYIDSNAAKAQTQASVAAQLAADAKLSAQQAATQAAQTQAQYQAMVTALTQQNATLAQAVTQRDSILGKQQAAVSTAPLTDVAQQWQTALGGSGDVTPSTIGLNISDSGARKTLTQLLALPVVQADLADAKEITKNTQAELDGANKNLAAVNTQVSALNTQLKADDVACKASIVALKAEGRKGKVKFFKIGFVTGFIAGLWAGHSAGL